MPLRPLRSLRAPAGVLVLAAWVRILFNDVTTFSRADETQYVAVTDRLLEHGYFAGYADLARDHLANPTLWPFPTPLRCGFFALTTLVGRVTGDFNYSTLAWISTLSGVAAVGFAWAIGRSLLDERGAIAGALLVAFSPLQLALSRRALQDEATCAFALAAIWAYVRLLESEPARARRWAIAALVLATLAMSVKETFVFYGPGFALLAWSFHRARRLRPWDLVPALAPVLFAAWYAALAGGFGAFFAMARCVLGSLRHEYATQFYSGEAHRSLLDLLALCFPSTLLALGAVGALVDRGRDEGTLGARRLAVFTVATLVACSLRLQVLRFVVGVDALLCLLAGWWLARLTARASRSDAWLGGAIAIAGAIDLHLFHRVFVQRAVYDPTTADVLRALDMLPR